MYLGASRPLLLELRLSVVLGRTLGVHLWTPPPFHAHAVGPGESGAVGTEKYWPFSGR